MSVGYIGADPDRLDALGQSLKDGAERLELLRDTLGMGFYSGAWVGPDADDARGEWETFHAPALSTAVGVLIGAGDRAHAHATQQRETSADVDLQWNGGGGGWPPVGYPGGDDPEALRAFWLNVAATNAGIDLSQWDPSQGAVAQSHIINAVYTYYANLYLDHPYMLWSGMAAMVGPSFAAGFYDLPEVREIAARIAERYGDQPFPVSIIAGPFSALANATEADFAFFETTFLTMQRDIFFDQAVMHEAYLAGGMVAVTDLYNAGIIDLPTLEAWRMIDLGVLTGEPAFLEAGNELLLLREQRDIIQGYYDQMYGYGIIGAPFTYAMGAIGNPAVPGAVPYGDFNPFIFSFDAEVTAFPGFNIPFIDQPGTDAYVTTPFPDGNLALFNDRWDYISGDTLPAFQNLVNTDPEQVNDILSTPVAERVEQYRLGSQAGDLLVRFFSDWDVEEVAD